MHIVPIPEDAITMCSMAVSFCPNESCKGISNANCPDFKAASLCRIGRNELTVEICKNRLPIEFYLPTSVQRELNYVLTTRCTVSHTGQALFFLRYIHQKSIPKCSRSLKKVRGVLET